MAAAPAGALIDRLVTLESPLIQHRISVQQQLAPVESRQVLQQQARINGSLTNAGQRQVASRSGQ